MKMIFSENKYPVNCDFALNAHAVVLWQCDAGRVVGDFYTEQHW